MASEATKRRREARLKILRMISENPEITTRKIADQVGISNGAAHYMLGALVDKGFVKLKNFSRSSSKVQYIYLLTPKGMHEKISLTYEFLRLKRDEHKALKEELQALERELHLDGSLPGDEEPVSRDV